MGQGKKVLGMNDRRKAWDKGVREKWIPLFYPWILQLHTQKTLKGRQGIKNIFRALNALVWLWSIEV